MTLIRRRGRPECLSLDDTQDSGASSKLNFSFEERMTSGLRNQKKQNEEARGSSSLGAAMQCESQSEPRKAHRSVSNEERQRRCRLTFGALSKLRSE